MARVSDKMKNHLKELHNCFILEYKQAIELLSSLMDSGCERTCARVKSRQHQRIPWESAEFFALVCKCGEELRHEFQCDSGRVSVTQG